MNFFQLYSNPSQFKLPGLYSVVMPQHYKYLLYISGCLFALSRYRRDKCSKTSVVFKSLMFTTLMALLLIKGCLWLMAQSIPSVPIPWTFVILFWKSCKCPSVGLKNRVQIPHPGTTPKLCFPVNKLQLSYLWEISQTRNVPYANLPQLLVIFIAKKITSI